MDRKKTKIISELVDYATQALLEAKKSPISENLQDDAIMIVGNLVNRYCQYHQITASESQFYFDEVYDVISPLLKEAKEIGEKVAWSEDRSDVTPEAGKLMDIDSDICDEQGVDSPTQIDYEVFKEELLKKINEEMPGYVWKEWDYLILEDYNFHTLNSALVQLVKEDKLEGRLKKEYMEKEYSLDKKEITAAPYGIDNEKIIKITDVGKKEAAYETWTDKETVQEPRVMVEKIVPANEIDQYAKLNMARGAVQYNGKMYTWTAKYDNDFKNWRGSTQLFERMMMDYMTEDDFRRVDDAIKKACKTGKETESKVDEQLAKAYERGKRQDKQSVKGKPDAKTEIPEADEDPFKHRYSRRSRLPFQKDSGWEGDTDSLQIKVSHKVGQYVSNPPKEAVEGPISHDYYENLIPIIKDYAEELSNKFVEYCKDYGWDSPLGRMIILFGDQWDKLLNMSAIYADEIVDIETNAGRLDESEGPAAVKQLRYLISWIANDWMARMAIEPLESNK